MGEADPGGRGGGHGAAYSGRRMRTVVARETAKFKLESWVWLGPRQERTRNRGLRIPLSLYLFTVYRPWT
jgi:hypothetical protein